MRKIHLIAITTVLICCISCVTGIYEMVNGRDKYVYENAYGRSELINKKYREKFTPGMAKGVIFDKLYYRYYENVDINYVSHSFIRFFKDGQFAYFSSKSNDIDFDNLNKANFIGYYTVDDTILKMETPTGNFNTAHFRVIWDARINKDTLEFLKPDYRGKYVIDNLTILDSKVRPDW